MPNLNSKGRGNNSMALKRWADEDVYSAVPQGLADMVKTELFEIQFPVMVISFIGSTFENDAGSTQKIL